MGEGQSQAEWYYVGHYGQLGPLTFDQMVELTTDGVIAPDTYVWKVGMGDWRVASEVLELRSVLAPAVPLNMPPPTPGMAVAPPPTRALQPAYPQATLSTNWAYLETAVPKSDKSRTVAGLLNLLPGVGRFYLGYYAHGALQVFTALFCMGIGFLWSIIDGIYILMGGVKHDGYGRVIQE